jgi:UDP-glucose 4-epimerase
MKKVLVVGVNSYIGKKFKKYVNMYHKDNLTVDMVSASDGSWERVDFSKYEVVIHLAAIVHRKEKKKMESLYYRVNYQLAVDVAMKAKCNNVKQFIFMSTAAVYGNHFGCITADTPTRPFSYYGKSKLYAEKAISDICNDGLSLCVLRPPMVYGEGCKGNYSSLRKVANILPIFPSYRNKKSVIHIDILTKYMVDVIMNQNRGIYHPQNNEIIATFDLVTDIRNQEGKKTVLVSAFNLFIEALLKHNKLKKVFGDFYYENLL